MSSLRIAHLSDPHFAVPSYSPLQFLSKRWMGNMNLLLFRKHAYQTEHLKHIPELLDSLGVDVVCITGDFSTTSRNAEFDRARSFVSLFKQSVHVLPGNHDCYTKQSEKMRSFYQFFPEESLRDQRVTKKSLGPGWWWVGLDCALSTSIIHSNGYFYPEMEEILDKVLRDIPQDDFIVMGNHFPLYSEKKWRHGLRRGEKLQALLKRYPNVKVYLHGHDHKPYIVDRRTEGFPLVFNAGSCAHKPDGTFYLIELSRETCLLERCLFRKDMHSLSWVIDLQKTYKF